ncbi:MAG: hypothetical protein OXC55_07700 [Chloroflexi bacterium]|nr:hypothetical protein [Chloroflexota bacterium]
MTTHDPTQSEADHLLALEKRRVDDTVWTYPGMGGSLTIPLISADRRERFLLDIRRGRVNLHKGSYQTRARNVVVLARLCFGGNPHDNPDGVYIASPHLHVYREGYADKWAYSLPEEFFTDITDPTNLLQGFQTYCNVVEPPIIRRELSP